MTVSDSSAELGSQTWRSTKVSKRWHLPKTEIAILDSITIYNQKKKINYNNKRWQKTKSIKQQVVEIYDLLYFFPKAPVLKKQAEE